MDGVDDDREIVSGERGAAGRGWSLRSLPPPSGPDPDAGVLGSGRSRTVLLTSSPLHGLLVLTVLVAWLLWIGLLFGLLRPTDTGGLPWPALLAAATIGTVVCAMAGWFCHRLTRSRSLTLSSRGLVARAGLRRIAAYSWREVRGVEIITGRAGVGKPADRLVRVAFLRLYPADKDRPPLRIQYPPDLADGLAALLEKHAGSSFLGVTESTEPLNAMTGRRSTWDWLSGADGWAGE